MSTKQQRNAPAPLRKRILKYLESRGKPVAEHTLFQEFAIRKGANRDELLGRLERMKTDGQLMVDRRGRFFLPGRVDMVRGRIQGHPDGYGFLIPEQAGQDLFLSSREMRKVLHGDTALAKVRRIDRRGRLEGTVVEVLGRGNDSVVGRLHVEDELSFVVPDNTRISQDIFIPTNARSGAQHGQIVVAEITRQPDKNKQPVGRVVEVLGEHMEPGMEIEIAIRKYDIPHQWPESISKETTRVPDKVRRDEVSERLDLRDLPLVTIDGEDAKDFDDAVFARCLDDGSWELIVAIADVSHYVDQGSGLDHEAYLRGNSVYFPERVVPMLPEVLSNGICSLNPNVDRLCFACVMQIDSLGEVLAYRFEPAVMRSHARLTYTQVTAALLDAANDDQTTKELLPQLQNLYSLSKVLNHRRTERGTIELELPETRIVFDQERKIQRIEPVHRNEAHRLIEECMLAANICAADFLAGTKGPAIYRVHERPNEEKIEDARAFIGEFGLVLEGGKQPTPKDFAEVVKRCEDEPFSHVVQVTLLRSLKQAEYSVELSEHFALGFERYTHFTSPIRRYPDLMVHRLIKHKIGEARVASSVDHESLGRIAEHCSVTERRADEATRNVIQWLKAEFMMDRVGEEFDGVATSVAEFGVFVELNELYVEGLVHVTSLGEDYFHYDPARRRLTGEHGGVMFQIGTEMRVRVVRVDIDQARIDFELVEGTARPRRRQRRKQRRQ